MNGKSVTQLLDDAKFYRRKLWDAQKSQWNNEPLLRFYERRYADAFRRLMVARRANRK